MFLKNYYYCWLNIVIIVINIIIIIIIINLKSLVIIAMITIIIIIIIIFIIIKKCSKSVDLFWMVGLELRKLRKFKNSKLQFPSSSNDKNNNKNTTIRTGTRI